MVTTGFFRAGTDPIRLPQAQDGPEYTQEQADAQLPYVLKWDKDGKYIEPEPKVPLLEDDPTGLELIENLFDDPQ